MPKRKTRNAVEHSATDTSSAYYKSRRYTAADLDDAKQEAREKASNEQSKLERDAFQLAQLDREIQDLEVTLHRLKMRHKDAHAAYTQSLTALARKLDSLI